VSSEPEIALRPVAAEDREFLFSVYASTRAEEMARVPWTAEQKAGFLNMQFTAQSGHYRAEFPAARHEIIVVNGKPAGRLYVDRGVEKLHILDITLLPEFRNAGVGTILLRRLLAEGRESGQPVTIYVESFNPSQRLFARLGFEHAGEQGFNWLLRWSPGDRPDVSPAARR
jgi:ribosomal protein S18 acetylase RimI-like enzyme